MFMDLFVPFWGPNEGTLQSMQPTRHERFVEHCTRFLSLGNIEECDLAVFPVEYQICCRPDREKFLLDFARLARDANKPLVVFVGGDLDTVPPVGDIILHTALYRSALGKNTFCMPPILEDLAERYLGGEISLREKTPIPSVSFCGAAPPFGVPFGKRWLKEQFRLFGYRIGLIKGKKIGNAPRAMAIRALKRARKLKTDIVIRAHSLVQFWCGHLVSADTKGNFTSPAQVADYRTEYVNRLAGSDYVLCVRGLGNYSLRLYECLCVGRIPIIVNTDMVFPLEELIDWKSIGIWVEESEIPKLEEKNLGIS